MVPPLKVPIPLTRVTYHTALWILTLRKLTGNYITQLCFLRFFSLFPASTEFHIVSDLTNSCARRVLSQSFRGLWRLCWANYLSIKVQENTDKYLIYFLEVGGTNQEQKKKCPDLWHLLVLTVWAFPLRPISTFSEVTEWGVLKSWHHKLLWAGTNCLSHTNGMIPPGTMTSNCSLAHFSVLFPSIS